MSVSLCRAAALALVLWFLCPGTAEAARFELQKIVDTATTIPETAVLFGAFRGRPALDAGQVAFQGLGSGEEGVYLWEASVLSTAVSSSTPIPGGTGTFNQLRDPSLEAGDLAYKGLDADNNVGTYKLIAGSNLLVADQSTLIPPGGVLPFVNVREPSLDGSDVSFLGVGAPGGVPGIYVEIAGVLSALADTTTAIPDGTGAFTSFGILTSMDGGEVAFKGDGTGGQAGIYRGTLAALVALADTSTSIPMGTGSFTGFGIPSLDGGQVAFQGSGSDGQGGIYLDTGQALLVLVNTSTPVPGDSGQFQTINPLLCLDAGNVAFSATTTSGQMGVYVYLSGELSKVVDLSTPVDGKTLSSLSIGQESLNGKQVVFRAQFSDGSQGVYLATLLPEPAPLFPPILLLVFGAVLLVITCRSATRMGGAQCS